MTAALSMTDTTNAKHGGAIGQSREKSFWNFP